MFWVLSHFGVEIVLQHAESGFGEPAFAGKFGAARGTNFAAGVKTGVVVERMGAHGGS